MAERRMFSKQIIDSDAFLDLPLSAQCLYFHLSMRADDDGFVNNARKIQRMIGAADDDCKLLIAKRFLLTFESGVIVIKHWRIHNYIQKDRYRPTAYEKEKAQIVVDVNNAYTEKKDELSTMDTKCIQNVSKVDTQDSIGKMYVNYNKKNNNQTHARAYTYKELVDKFRGFFETHIDDKFAKAGYEIIDTLQTVFDIASRTEQGIHFNNKWYDLNSVIRIVDNISEENFEKIVATLVFNKNISTRPAYILGCIINMGDK